MMIRTGNPRRRRRGAVLVESALVYPALMSLAVGGLGLGLALYNYQEVSHLARESARWASLQAPSMRTPAQILDKVVRPKAVYVNPDAVTITSSSSSTGMAVVTISYAWPPPANPQAPQAGTGSFSLRSTAQARIPDQENQQ